MTNGDFGPANGRASLTGEQGRPFCPGGDGGADGQHPHAGRHPFPAAERIIAPPSTTSRGSPINRRSRSPAWKSASVKNVELVDDHAPDDDRAFGKTSRSTRTPSCASAPPGIIGTKFIALDPGQPEPRDPRKKTSGCTAATRSLGEDTLSIDELMERVAKSLDDVTGGGKLGDNLNATMENLRSHHRFAQRRPRPAAPGARQYRQERGRFLGARQIRRRASG